MHTAIIPGHGHRMTSAGAYRYDPGAVSELGQEAEIVRAIAQRALQLGRGRVTVHDSDRDGPWSYTWRRNQAHAAIGNGPGVVVHLHVNAGGGSYLLGMHDRGATPAQHTRRAGHRRSARRLSCRRAGARCSPQSAQRGTMRLTWSSRRTLQRPRVWLPCF